MAVHSKSVFNRQAVERQTPFTLTCNSELQP